MILLIETDHVLAKNIRGALVGEGYEVEWLVDPQTAVISCDAYTPEVIMLDLLMAGRSGVEFMYEFRSYPEWLGIPVIILSSLPAEDAGINSEGFAQLDVVRFFYKPSVSLREIVEAVGELTQPIRV